MKSVENFDIDLMKIGHFEYHPEMLPYIGLNYDTHRILIVSESHFMPKGKSQPDDNWYNSFVSLEKEDKFYTDGNTKTRSVVEQFKHRIFTNLNSGLKKVDINPPLDFSYVAWYNFFQKPAVNKNSIKIIKNSLDVEIAVATFESILNIIQPNAIIFSSSKAFSYLSEKRWNDELLGHKFKDYNIPLNYVSHPNSHWWYKNMKKIMNQERKNS